jgi:L-seryl-tRNA(Ser) seleniumtransferase
MEADELLRGIPAVDELLRRREVATLVFEAALPVLTAWIRESLSDLRRRVRSGDLGAAGVASEIEALPGRLRERAAALARAPLRRVINATGVVVHTNLGRSPLPAGALEAVVAASGSYSNLEYDLAGGARGSRMAHLERASSALFAGRSLLAVNNNAAGVLLVLNTLAEGGEVILSRGEMVEIGGSFRIPDVMAKAGARLREVGTTNRTRLSDYREAMGSDTALLAKVHTSNYRIVGFVEETPVEEIAALAREKGIPFLVDEGSGYMGVAGGAHMRGEPSVGGLLEAGASLVTFSGDKLLGGPQAGLIVGDPALVSRCARNPLARALRVDKMTLAALAWTLAEYAAGRAQETLPVLGMLQATPESIGARAAAIAARLSASAVTDEPGVEERVAARVEARVEDGTSRVGGGAAPMRELPTRVLAIRPLGKSAAAFEESLRGQDPPVIARIEAGRVLLDLRTVDPSEDELVAAALASAVR